MKVIHFHSLNIMNYFNFPHENHLVNSGEWYRDKGEKGVWNAKPWIGYCDTCDKCGWRNMLVTKYVGD